MGLRHFSVLVLALFIQSTALAASDSWSGKLRPGFVGGNHGNASDYYLDMLIPIWGGSDRLLFFNPNLRFDSHDGNEQNLGLGYRQLVADEQWIFGVNAYYDTMRSENGKRYRQWAVGVEALGQWVDLRGNYYRPFGDTDNVISGTGGASSFIFSGNSLLAIGGGTTEQAPDGYDVEASVLIPGLSSLMETRLAWGVYRFDVRNARDVDGWRARLEVRPVPALSIGIETRDDDVRGRDSFFGAYLDVPFAFDELLAGGNPFAGHADQWAFGKGVRPMRERMTDKVVRDRNIIAVVNQTGAGGQAPVVDNKMIFVNQDNEEEGVGTFENPYQSLVDATEDIRFGEDAWVYIFSSDDEADTYSEVSLRLHDGMVLWGQAYMHPEYGLGGGPSPVLDGITGEIMPEAVSKCPRGTVVCLADNNEIMGLTIQNGFEGIYASNIGSTSIHHNIIRNNPDPGRFGDASGIHIYNHGTPAEVSGLTFDFTISDNMIIDNGSTGVYLVNEIEGEGGTVANLTVNNTISRNTLYGNFNSAEFKNVDSNIYVFNGIVGANIDGAHINNTFEENVIRRCENGGGECASSVNDGIVLGNSMVAGDAGSINNAHYNNRFVGNTVTDMVENGITLTARHEFAETTHFGQKFEAFNVTNVSSTSTFTDNVIRDNGRVGIYSPDEDRIRGVRDPGDSEATATVDGAHVIKYFTGNEVVNNGISGIITNNEEIASSSLGGGRNSIANASVEFYFTSNTVTGNGLSFDGHTGGDSGHGIYFYADSSGDEVQRRLFMQGNNVSGNQYDGLRAYFNGNDPEVSGSLLDLGGGGLGSSGGNSFTGNGLLDIRLRMDAYPVTAQMNWWGQPEGMDPAQTNEPELVDASSPLAIDPFAP